MAISEWQPYSFTVSDLIVIHKSINRLLCVFFSAPQRLCVSNS